MNVRELVWHMASSGSANGTMVLYMGFLNALKPMLGLPNQMTVTKHPLSWGPYTTNGAFYAYSMSDVPVLR